MPSTSCAGDRCRRAGRRHRRPDRPPGPWPACAPAASPAHARRCPRQLHVRAHADAAAGAPTARRRRHLGRRSRVRRERVLDADLRAAGAGAEPAEAARALRGPPLGLGRLRAVADEDSGPAAGLVRFSRDRIGTRSSAAAAVVVRGRRSATAMIGVPTWTVSPSGTSSSVMVPANGDGSSTSDLAVSISTIDVVELDRVAGLDLPGDDLGLDQALAHVGEAEVLDAHQYPSDPVDAVEHPVQVGEVLLLDPARRVGRVEPADAQHRRLEGVEALLGDPRRDLRTQAQRDRRLVDDDRRAGSCCTDSNTGRQVQRRDRPQVDDLELPRRPRPRPRRPRAQVFTIGPYAEQRRVGARRGPPAPEQRNAGGTRLVQLAPSPSSAASARRTRSGRRRRSPAGSSSTRRPGWSTRRP